MYRFLFQFIASVVYEKYEIKEKLQTQGFYKWEVTGI